MRSKETPIEQYYIELIEHTCSTLTLSLAQIKERFINHHISVLDHVEEGIHKKSIEIRLNKEEITLTCILDDNGKCKSIFLFPDYEHITDSIIKHFMIKHKYSLLKQRFSLLGSSIKVKVMSELINTTYLKFSI